MMMVSKGDCWRKKEEWNCPVIIGEWSLSRPHSWLYLQFRFIPALPGDDGKCDPDWLWQHKTIQPYNCRLPASALPGHSQDKSYLIFVISFTQAGFFSPKFLHPKTMQNTQILQQIPPKGLKYAVLRVQFGKIYTGQNFFTRAPPVVPVTNMRYATIPIQCWTK